jgi:hypothetical protein
MVAKDVRCLVAIDYRHLNIHQYDVWLGLFACLGRLQIFEGFLAIPYSIYFKPEFLNRFSGNLLVDRAAETLAKEQS